MVFNAHKIKQATRSGTPTAWDPDSRNNRKDPYAKNDPLKGEGMNLVTMGEDDAVGGGNTKRPATMNPGTNADPRTSEYPLYDKQSPAGRSILENEEAGVLDSEQGGKSRPGTTEAWKNWLPEGSPLSDLNQSELDDNTFQSNLNFRQQSPDIFNGVSRRRL